MAVRHGYGKVAGADALVFAYDTGDVKNSFKGRPTTNLATLDLGNWINEGGSRTLLDQTFKGNPVYRWKSNPGQIWISPFAWNTNFDLSTNDITVSAYFYNESGNTETVGMYFGKDFSTDSAGNPNYRSIPVDGKWHRHSWTMYAGSGTNYLEFRTSSDTMLISSPMVENGRIPSEPVEGTRSATQGLQDITKSSKAKSVKINGNRYPIIEDANGRWVKVFGHYNANGTILFGSVAEATLTNADNPSANKFSILGRIEQLRRRDGKFKFKLEYPEQPSRTNIWYQTSNPTSQAIAGYEAISIGYSGNYWGGLEYYGDATADTFINGSVGHSNWYFAIGSFSAWSGAIPGPGVPVNYVNVYLSVEDTFLGDGGIDLSNVSFDANGKMTFDGTDDKAVIKGFPHIWDGSVTMETVVAWYDDSRSILLGNYNVGANDINFEKLEGRRLRFYWNRGERDVTTGNNVVTTAGDYHHVVMVRDKTANAFKLYVNGVLLNTIANVGTDVTSTGNTFRIGADTRNGATVTNGEIPVMKVYDRALTTSEIINNYNNYKGRFNI